MALTEKKLIFAKAVLAGKSNRDAAVAAGYSVKTASQAGSRLVKDAAVAAYLEKKRAAAPIEVGLTAADGTKSEGAGTSWPFGVAVDEPAPAPKLTAREYLSSVVNNIELDEKVRTDAAKKLIEFEEAKPAPIGKKAAQNDAARKISKFTSAAPPKLVAANGSRVH